MANRISSPPQLSDLRLANVPARMHPRGMDHELYQFAIWTPSVDLLAELPLSVIIQLVRDNAPDAYEAEAAIAMISGGLTDASAYNGNRWYCFIARRNLARH